MPQLRKIANPPSPTRPLGQKRQTDMEAIRMKTETTPQGDTIEINTDTNPSNKSTISRRSFLSRVGGVATVAATAGAMTTLGPILGGKESLAEAVEIGPLSDSARADASYNYRVAIATAERANPIVAHPCNGDEALYADKGATFSKCLVHDSFGRVDTSSYNSYINALTTGNPLDFNSIIVGGTRHLVGPQGGLAFDPEGGDGHNFTTNPAPVMAGAQTAAEMVEMYWASLLRDVSFVNYPTNNMAAKAAAELNLFPGETVGPYISQLMWMPTNFGNQPISQKFTTFVSGTDYMTDFPGWLAVQNGGSTGQSLVNDSTPRYV